MAAMARFSHTCHKGIWETMLQKVVDFERDNGRLPSKTKGGRKVSSSADEKRLAEWLATERCYQRNPNHKCHKADRAAMLRKCGYLGPDGVMFIRGKKGCTWETMLQEVVDFERDNGRLPRTTKGAKEKRLAEWLATERCYQRNANHTCHKADPAAMLRKRGYLGPDRRKTRESSG